MRTPRIFLDPPLDMLVNAETHLNKDEVDISTARKGTLWTAISCWFCDAKSLQEAKVFKKKFWMISISKVFQFYWQVKVRRWKRKYEIGFGIKPRWIMVYFGQYAKNICYC